MTITASHRRVHRDRITVTEPKRGGLGVEATAQCSLCGAEHWFLNPTPDRVDWYRSSHRCGGEGWQG